MVDVKGVTRSRQLLWLSASFFLLSILAGLLLMVTNWTVTTPLSKTFVAVYVVFLAFLLLVALVRLEKSLRFGLFVLLTANFFWFGLPALRALLGQTTWYGRRRYFYALSEVDVVQTTLFLITFLVFSIVLYLFTVNLFADRQSQDLPPLQASLTKGEVVAIGSILFLLGILPFIVYGEGLTTIVQGIFGSRAAFDAKPWAHAAFESRPLTVLGRATMVVLGELGLLFALRNGSFRVRFFAGIAFMVAFAITYFDSGTRSWTLLMVAPPALVALRVSIDLKQYRRWLIIGAVMAMALVWISQLQLQFRVTGFSQDTLSSYDYYFVEDNDFFAETIIAVSLVPNRLDYVREFNTVLFLSNPIPRAIWPDKPFPRIVQVYGIGRRGFDQFLTDGGSSMPSIVGQHFMNWGIAGVIYIGAALGIVFAWIDQKWRQSNQTSLRYLWLATTSVWLFVSFRGLLPGFHYPVVILGAIVLLENELRTQRHRKRRSAGQSSVRTTQPSPVQ